MDTNLTPNEMRAAITLVKSCLNGMGGDRPADLEHDTYTWIAPEDLHAAGYSKHEAAGTWGALMEKGFIDQADEDEFSLADDAWRWLDTQWDNIER